MVMTNRTGMITRGRVRPRTRRCVLFAAVPAALAALALSGCGGSGSSGSSGYDTAALAKDIRASLDQHPGFTVRSVSCPPRAKQAKGVVIRCSATLRNGEVDQMRATQTDGNGTIHLVGSLIFADNVERAVTANVSGGGARVTCPNHVPVVIGNSFSCTLTHAGSYSRARITIVDGDGGIRMSFS